MTRDPLLPVRLVDGVWTTDGAGSAAVPTEHHPGIMALGRGAEWPCSVTLPPRPATDYARAFAEYNPPTPMEVTIPVTVNADDWREFVEVHNDPITIEHNAATGETSVSFDAEAIRPGEVTK